jgi:hypothetical protein
MMENSGAHVGVSGYAISNGDPLKILTAFDLSRYDLLVSSSNNENEAVVPLRSKELVKEVAETYLYIFWLPVREASLSALEDYIYLPTFLLN